MISANELRVGNIVKDADCSICTIRSIDSERSYTYKGIIYTGTASVFIHKYNGTTGKWIESLSPIKLTEEILLKCGAKKDGWEFKLKACALEITIRLNAGYVYCEFGNVYLGDRITYLHELQNLVYGLSKRELDVKL
ncbi:MAG: hypothetical protein LBF27_25730 [Sphingobacterium sp.]|jgi:hypothetical protein|nr:hypothetical protein [Sphingobacterium sp.]